MKGGIGKKERTERKDDVKVGKKREGGDMTVRRG
jgi:hypothetical protein